MPAVRAASGLAPTARRRKPRVERCISHHVKSTASSATKKPQCSRKSVPSSRGNMAERSSGADTGFVVPGARRTGVFNR